LKKDNKTTVPEQDTFKAKELLFWTCTIRNFEINITASKLVNEVLVTPPYQSWQKFKVIYQFAVNLFDVLVSTIMMKTYDSSAGQIPLRSSTLNLNKYDEKMPVWVMLHSLCVVL